MNKIREAARWTDFVLSLKETIAEIERNIDQSSKEVEGLETQNLLILEKLENFSGLLDRLENRLDRIEDRLNGFGKNVIDVDHTTSCRKIEDNK